MPKADETLEPTMHVKLVAPSGTPVQNDGYNSAVPTGRIQVNNISGVEHNTERYNSRKRTVFTQFERLLRLLYE